MLCVLYLLCNHGVDTEARANMGVGLGSPAQASPDGPGHAQVDLLSCAVVLVVHVCTFIWQPELLTALRACHRQLITLVPLLLLATVNLTSPVWYASAPAPRPQ
jgi:hypothetical protein